MISLPQPRLALTYAFCRMQLPAVFLSWDAFGDHAHRTFDLFIRKAKESLDGSAYLDRLYAVDWYLCCACLEGEKPAWEVLFAARTGRSDCLLIDALRARASRLFPGNEERQDSAVTEFWGDLIISETDGKPGLLARYDGQRPLVPWLLVAFVNRHLSVFRKKGDVLTMPDEEVAVALPGPTDSRWHEAFVTAASEWLSTLKEEELLILGLRWRYRLTQREVAQLLGIHEGNVTRRFQGLRDRCVKQIGESLVQQGWTGDNVADFVLIEMGTVLTDDPRLSADHVGSLLRARGKELPSG